MTSKTRQAEREANAVKKALREPIVQSVLNLIGETRSINPDTKNNIATEVSKYVEFRNLKEPYTLEQMLNDAKNNQRKTIQDFEDYFYFQQGEEIKGYPKIEKPMLASSAKVATYGRVASLFKHTGILIRIPTPEISKKSLAIQADKEYEFSKLDEETNKTYIDKTILQKFLNNLSIRDRSVGLCMLSSSQDSGDLFDLTVGDFKKGLNGKKIRFFWDNGRNKTGKSFQTFFSTEATQSVKDYLSTDRKISDLTYKPNEPAPEDNEPLFTQTGEGAKKMLTGSLGQTFRVNATEVGIEWDNTKYQNPFRGKRLRHFFRTCAGEAGIETEYKHIFMGHVLNQNDKYDETRAKLEQQYVRVEPYLKIFTGSEEIILKQTLAEYGDLVKEQRDEIRELKNDRQDLKDKYNELIQENKEISNQMQELREKVEMYAIKPETELLLKQLGELMLKKEQ